MAKRIVDVVGAAALLFLATPLILAGAIVSVSAYRANPFFVQRRIGRDGRPFRIVKIRTLAPATPTSLPTAELEPHRPGAACRFLRSHHLDELPQLIAVLGGSMSLVGPRPEMPALESAFTPEFARLRTQVRPGLTGLWQISTALEGQIADAPEYDRAYVLHQTARLDWWILGRTALGLLGRAAIASPAQIPRWTGSTPRPVEASVERAAA